MIVKRKQIQVVEMKQQVKILELGQIIDPKIKSKYKEHFKDTFKDQTLQSDCDRQFWALHRCAYRILQDGCSTSRCHEECSM